MRNLFLILSALLLAATAFKAQESRQVPKGIREADKAEVAFEKSVPPPQIIATKPKNLQEDADHLAKLAQSIPGDCDRVGKGMLPKDMIQKLKQIEKLSKRLRNELNP